MNYDYHMRPKIRLVDPLVWVDGQAQRLSVVDPVVRERNEEFLRCSQNGYYVKVHYSKT